MWRDSCINEDDGGNINDDELVIPLLSMTTMTTDGGKINDVESFIPLSSLTTDWGEPLSTKSQSMKLLKYVKKRNNID